MAEVSEVNVSHGGSMAEGEGGGGGGKLKLIIIAVVVLLLLGGAGFAVMLFMGGGGEEVAEETATAPPAVGRVTGVGKPCETEQLRYLDLGEFVVNLADGRRYLKTTIKLVLCTEGVETLETWLTFRLDEVKDRMVARLQTLSTEQLRSPREREELRQDLLNEIYRLLPNGDVEWDDPEPVKKVLLTEFYLQ